MKKELKILGLSYSQTQLGSYVIVLSDVTGGKKLPIIIKPTEAQRIAIEIEGIKPSRPMIHDVFKTMNDHYQVDIQEINIHNLLEGVFYTNIVTTNGLDEVSIECTAGDAIALSVIYKCPIYTTSEILDTAGVVIDDYGNDIQDESTETKTKRVVSVEDLEKMMSEAISNEEYELAADLRDRIEELKNKS